MLDDGLDAEPKRALKKGMPDMDCRRSGCNAGCRVRSGDRTRAKLDREKMKRERVGTKRIKGGVAGFFFFLTL